MRLTVVSDFQTLGYDKYSLLGWSDGGITSLMMAATFPQHVERMVVWGSNAYVSEEEIEIFGSKCCISLS